LSVEQKSAMDDPEDVSFFALVEEWVLENLFHNQAFPEKVAYLAEAIVSIGGPIDQFMRPAYDRRTKPVYPSLYRKEWVEDTTRHIQVSLVEIHKEIQGTLEVFRDPCVDATSGEGDELVAVLPWGCVPVGYCVLSFWTLCRKAPRGKLVSECLVPLVESRKWELISIVAEWFTTEHLGQNIGAIVLGYVADDCFVKINALSGVSTITFSESV
jgi:hypothetical protein